MNIVSQSPRLSRWRAPNGETLENDLGATTGGGSESMTTCVLDDCAGGGGSEEETSNISSVDPS